MVELYSGACIRIHNNISLFMVLIRMKLEIGGSKWARGY